MLRVGVLRGGADERYKTSIDNGANILNCLRREPLSLNYKAVDIFVDEDGVWHIDGIPVSMEKVKQKVDLVINALLGKYAESGKIQEILENHNIKYASSDSKSSTISHNKVLTKEEFLKLRIKTPNFIHLKSYKTTGLDKSVFASIKARTVWEKMSPPWIVKPVTNGSSVGVVLCRTFNELVDAIEKIADSEDDILVEEFIRGKEATVGVINNFRKKEIYALPPIEIRLKNRESIFSYRQKNNNLAETICPGTFLPEEKKKMEEIAILIHKNFGLKFYSKTDFIVHPQKGIYVLEVNSQSEFMEKSQIPIALEAVGSSLEEFIDHLIVEATKL